MSWFRRLFEWSSAGDAVVRVDDDAWQRIVESVPWIAALSPPRAARAREFAQRFLRSKTISAAADFELTREQRLIIATLAVLPVLEGSFDWLKDWHEVIVYPGQFGVRRQHHDEGTGVISEWDDELSGESWDRGPVILSWADIAQDLAEPDAGHCVVVHEIAHKLDALDGVMDGTPPLPDRAAYAAWARDFQRAYDLLCATLEAGAEPPIYAYAAEAPEEFFAVVSEYHFSAPDVLAAAMPEIAAHLTRLYGPVPFA